MNFKDLQFSLGKLTTGAYSHFARNNPLQKQDTKALSAWIFEERNDLYVTRMRAYHHGETLRAFEHWIKEEHQEGKEDARDLEVRGKWHSEVLLLIADFDPVSGYWRQADKALEKTNRDWGSICR